MEIKNRHDLVKDVPAFEDRTAAAYENAFQLRRRSIAAAVLASDATEVCAIITVATTPYGNKYVMCGRELGTEVYPKS